MSSTARRMRAAFSGDVVLRCSSLNHCTCSAVAPGMNSEVKIWRKAGFSWPQPWRMRVSTASACSILGASRACACRARTRRRARDGLRARDGARHRRWRRRSPAICRAAQTVGCRWPRPRSPCRARRPQTRCRPPPSRRGRCRARRSGSAGARPRARAADGSRSGSPNRIPDD